MQTIKKKDISKYDVSEVFNSEEEKDNVSKDKSKDETVDELVNSSGGSIDGDEKNVNNSEIKVAPQQTGDQYADVAIQPNRLHFNVGAVGAAGNSISSGDNISDSYDIAKHKMIGLLESISEDDGTSFISDVNNNDINDINELPKNVARKLTDLVNSVKSMNLDDNKIEIITNFVNSSLNSDNNA